MEIHDWAEAHTDTVADWHRRYKYDRLLKRGSWSRLPAPAFVGTEAKDSPLFMGGSVPLRGSIARIRMEGVFEKQRARQSKITLGPVGLWSKKDATHHRPNIGGKVDFVVDAFHQRLEL